MARLFVVPAPRGESVEAVAERECLPRERLVFAEVTSNGAELVIRTADRAAEPPTSDLKGLAAREAEPKPIADCAPPEPGPEPEPPKDPEIEPTPVVDAPADNQAPETEERRADAASESVPDRDTISVRPLSALPWREAVRVAAGRATLKELDEDEAAERDGSPRSTVLKAIAARRVELEG